MFPKNAASPERIAVGQVVLTADGTIQSSDVVITTRGQGAAETPGDNSAVMGADNTVYYTPSQDETNFTSFTVIASKASCFSASVTVVTSESSVAGQVVLTADGITAAKIADDALANEHFADGALTSTEVTSVGSVDNLTIGAGGISTTANNTVFTKTPTTETETETATIAEDGTYHTITDDTAATDTDFYYIFDVGASGVPQSVTWTGYCNGNGRSEEHTSELQSR